MKSNNKNDVNGKKSFDGTIVMEYLLLRGPPWPPWLAASEVPVRPVGAGVPHGCQLSMVDEILALATIDVPILQLNRQRVTVDPEKVQSKAHF